MDRGRSLETPPDFSGASIERRQIAGLRGDIEESISQDRSAPHPAVNTGLPNRFLRSSPPLRRLSAGAAVVAEQRGPVAISHFLEPCDKSRSYQLSTRWSICRSSQVPKPSFAAAAM